MGAISRLFFAALLCSWSAFAYAADLTPTEVYAKCHARLSDHPVDIDSYEYKQVQAGKLDPIKACEKILDRTMFVSSGNRKVIKNQNDPIAIGTLRNFNEFHKSWFSAFGEMSAPEGGLFNFLDYSEPALFITEALFGRRHYRTIFTRKDSIRGFRKASEKPSAYIVRNTNYDSIQLIAGPLDGKSTNITASNVELVKLNRVSLGYLVGIEPTPKMMLQQDMRLIKSEITEAQWPTAFEDDGDKIDISENFGGGILGSPAYTLFNSETTARKDGGENVYRRMANNTFYDLMCLTMPTLTSKGDIQAYLNKYKKSKISFRRDQSCAGCHATLDPMADAARNLVISRSAPVRFRLDLREKFPSLARALEVNYIKKYKVRTNAQSVEDVDKIYPRRAAHGKLYYKDYKGDLVDKSVNGLADLGNKIAAQDDIYMCAAQRYYHFLTGVNVSVAHSTSDAFHTKHRNNIIEMGKNLKNHGSLRRLIVDILKSDAFQTRALNLELAEGGE